ncbi:hypothetical protein BJ980_003197 [Nocardioides daedukensis]|uniref:Uncharacterized protein n=1 Tax=Nocardioides daedukensis TaxID=634462 RepID=A0A7Y9S3E5_9ACTN|nr:hypothetical protein [Nocardioides daedukensis]NYG60274.1 hypothetical protein [Nocardioides daedukensis]
MTGLVRRSSALIATGVLVLTGLAGCGGGDAEPGADPRPAATPSAGDNPTGATGKTSPKVPASPKTNASGLSSPASASDDLPTRGADGTQDSVLAKLPGPSSQKCVDVDKNRDVRSGSMAAGPFDEVRSNYEQGAPATQEVRLYFIPEKSAKMPGISVRLHNKASNKTITVRQKRWADAGEFRFYDVQTGLPTKGTWQITAQAGPDKGCWTVQLG